MRVLREMCVMALFFDDKSECEIIDTAGLFQKKKCLTDKYFSRVMLFLKPII